MRDLGRQVVVPVILVTMALILIFGHGLNILLCALAVLVHGVRLNVLEFASHMKMEWSGIPYTPVTTPEGEGGEVAQKK